MFELKRSQLKNHHVLKFGYCEKYEIFKYLREIGYTRGIYWRNETIYIVDWCNTLLSTGYRPSGDRPLNDEKREKFNKLIASKQRREKHRKQPFETKRKYINKKIAELIHEHFRILNDKKNGH